VVSNFRNDMAAVYSAFDVSTSCSLSEGFSNTLAEAMACGVPCVATDVGDARVILGETGLVVGSRNPTALAQAWERMLRSNRTSAREACRRRIVDCYGVEALAARTLSLLADTTEPTRSRSPAVG
jgi:glycosyltransferase involved in cell wall biosynthesis